MVAIRSRRICELKEERLKCFQTASLGAVDNIDILVVSNSQGERRVGNRNRSTGGSMATSERFTEPAVLTSWKEVAAYLGTGVRTVQRWEKDDGLPIRRIAGTSKIVVSRAELDLWLKSQPAENGGGRALKVAFPDIQSAVAQARELRQRHRALRLAVNGAMAQLINECRRMRTNFSGTAEMHVTQPGKTTRR